MSQAQEDSFIKALPWMLFSAISFAAMASFAKWLSEYLSSHQLVFYRSLISGLLAWIVILFARKKLNYEKPDKGSRWMLFLRGLFGFFGLSCFFYTISKISLIPTVILINSSPIFVALYSGPIAKEPVPKLVYLWLMAAIASLCLFFYDGLVNVKSLEWLPVVIGLVGANFAGLAYTLTRRLSKTYSNSTIVLSFALTATLGSLVFIFFSQGQNVLGGFSSDQVIFFAVLLGVSAYAAQFAMTQAYRSVRSSTVASF